MRPPLPQKPARSCSKVNDKRGATFQIGKQKAGSKKNASPPGCGAVGGDAETRDLRRHDRRETAARNACNPFWLAASYALAAARCLSTHYCSDVCQREAWANLKLLCKTLGAGREEAFAARERSAPGSAKKSLKMDDDVIMAWYRAFPGLAVDRVSSLEAPTRKPNHQVFGAVDQLSLVSGRDGDSSPPRVG